MNWSETERRVEFKQNKEYIFTSRRIITSGSILQVDIFYICAFCLQVDSFIKRGRLITNGPIYKRTYLQADSLLQVNLFYKWNWFKNAQFY